MYFFLSSDLLPSSKSEKTKIYICLFSTQIKLECSKRATLLTQINSVNQREGSWIWRECLAVKWANNPGLSKEWASRGLADPKCGQFLEAVIYLQTQVFPFIVNTQSVILARSLGHFLYSPLNPCQHATFIFLFAPLLTATQATNTHQRHIRQLWLGLCQKEFSPLFPFLE